MLLWQRIESAGLRHGVADAAQDACEARCVRVEPVRHQRHVHLLHAALTAAVATAAACERGLPNGLGDGHGAPSLESVVAIHLGATRVGSRRPPEHKKAVALSGARQRRQRKRKGSKQPASSPLTSWRRLATPAWALRSRTAAARALLACTDAHTRQPLNQAFLGARICQFMLASCVAWRCLVLLEAIDGTQRLIS